MAGTYTKLYYHIVFSTKHRRPLITPNIENDLHRYLQGVVEGIGGTPIEVNGAADHVHILALLPPKIAVSDALRDIKANSSKWLHDSRDDYGGFRWQDGFAAFTVSKSVVETVREYIRNQKRHHVEWNYQAELLELLNRHEVEYDERYLWD
jgi:REP element-mobilizing transposase RayT